MAEHVQKGMSRPSRCPIMGRCVCAGAAALVLSRVFFQRHALRANARKNKMCRRRYVAVCNYACKCMESTQAAGFGQRSVASREGGAGASAPGSVSLGLVARPPRARAAHPRSMAVVQHETSSDGPRAQEWPAGLSSDNLHGTDKRRRRLRLGGHACADGLQRDGRGVRKRVARKVLDVSGGRIRLVEQHQYGGESQAKLVGMSRTIVSSSFTSFPSVTASRMGIT